MRFASARLAFASWLQQVDFDSDGVILLPGYIGWSQKEGSGVFDPIASLGLRFAFYRLNRQLQIDMDSVTRLFEQHRVRAVLLVHYFGFPDPCAPDVVGLAEQHGALVMEDEAHAMLSDLVGGACGRRGDAAVFSLHKLLPVRDGGVLVINRDDNRFAEGTKRSDRTEAEYDLAAISLARRRNAMRLLACMDRLGEDVQPLWPTLPEGVVPQTLPIIVLNRSRDDLYFAMNASGFGVVSLYHTMISALDRTEHSDAFWVAKRIMNLPVHQDIEIDDLDALVTELGRQLVQRGKRTL